MNQLEIKPASLADLAVIQQLARKTISDCYRPYLGDTTVDWFLESGGADEELEVNLGKCDILLENKQPVGLVICIDNLIHLIMVDSRRHRKGLGSSLLSHCEAKLSVAGYKQLRVEIFKNNKQALNFFLKNNWKVIKESQEDMFGFVKITMQKNIIPQHAH